MYGKTVYGDYGPVGQWIHDTLEKFLEVTHFPLEGFIKLILMAGIIVMAYAIIKNKG